MQDNSYEQSEWILLPPGNLAFMRKPADIIPEGCRQATASEMGIANRGQPFPWGSLTTPANAGRMWDEHRIGTGGLYHDKWFVTSDGRFGGARNVPQQLPGTLRSSFLYDGGQAAQPDQLAGNEGFAVVREVSLKNRDLYRKVQMHAAEHVVADGGAIIVSPLAEETNTVYVGFVGRCQTCPNPEMISFRQLKAAVPGYNFELLSEWKNWSLSAPPSTKSAAL